MVSRLTRRTRRLLSSFPSQTLGMLPRHNCSHLNGTRYLKERFCGRLRTGTAGGLGRDPSRWSLDQWTVASSAVLWMCGDKACNGGDDLVFRAVVAVVVERTARGEGNPSTPVNDDFGLVLVGNAL